MISSDIVRYGWVWREIQLFYRIILNSNVWSCNFLYFTILIISCIVDFKGHTFFSWFLHKYLQLINMPLYILVNVKGIFLFRYLFAIRAFFSIFSSVVWYRQSMPVAHPLHGSLCGARKHFTQPHGFWFSFFQDREFVDMDAPHNGAMRRTGSPSPVGSPQHSTTNSAMNLFRACCGGRCRRYEVRGRHILASNTSISEAIPSSSSHSYPPQSDRSQVSQDPAIVPNVVFNVPGDVDPQRLQSASLSNEYNETRVWAGIGIYWCDSINSWSATKLFAKTRFLRDRKVTTSCHQSVELIRDFLDNVGLLLSSWWY